MENKKREMLQLRKNLLLRQIQTCLDLLQGSLHINPSQRGFHLTTKVARKTVTKYVRSELVLKFRVMTRSCLQRRKLLQRLSDVNWRLLQLPPALWTDEGSGATPRWSLLSLPARLGGVTSRSMPTYWISCA